MQRRASWKHPVDQKALTATFASYTCQAADLLTMRRLFCAEQMEDEGACLQAMAQSIPGPSLFLTEHMS